MIYRFTSNIALCIAKQDNYSENFIGLALDNQPFELPLENDVKTWLQFPHDIVAIDKNVWESEQAMIIERTDNDLKQSQSECEFVLEENGVYLYKNKEDKYYEIHGKASKEEADTYVNECVAIAMPKNILIAKNNKIKEIKAKCASILSRTDYKVVRHRDQLDGNQTTTLTDAEYKTLLADREALRAKSNLFESEVMALTTLQAINEYTYSY